MQRRTWRQVKWYVATYIAAAWCQLVVMTQAYPRISLNLVREHDGDVELLRKLLQARQEQVEFLMSAANLSTAHLLALAELAAARVVLAWLSAIGGRSVAHGRGS